MTHYSKSYVFTAQLPTFTFYTGRVVHSLIRVFFQESHSEQHGPLATNLVVLEHTQLLTWQEMLHLL